MPASRQLLGPFRQIITMANLPGNGPINDDELEIIQDGGLIIEKGMILKVGPYAKLRSGMVETAVDPGTPSDGLVLTPGLIDAHTHMCFAGSRARDYSLRLQGVSYLEIARQGGGIMDTVRQTRNASLRDLTESLRVRCARHLADGITTCEVKSGYGLNVVDELKMLSAIRQTDEEQIVDLIPTCLAAHVCPPEFNAPEDYIHAVITELLPEVSRQKLSRRVDIFVEQGAFQEKEARAYFEAALNLGFSVTVHADQFTVGGSRLAAEYGAASADHLEVSGSDEIELMVQSDITGTVLPGATLGLGLPFAPARRMLDAGMRVAIASDWNPGSAPMGDLLVQASLLGVHEKLSIAETLAGITCRAARALGLEDRGIISPGKKADLIAFPCADYREILYQQGKLKPAHVWKNGVKI